MSTGNQPIPGRAAKPRAAAAPQTKAPVAALSNKPVPAPAPHLTGAQLATAFDGKLERRGTTFGYRVAIVLVAVMMLVLPVIYLAIIAGAGWLTIRWATYASGMFRFARYGRASVFLLAIYLAPIIAGALLVLSMILSMFWRSTKGPKPYWVDRREQPLLYAYIERLCAATGAPVPARIDVLATANAAAHIDNGIFGLFHRRMVLTIGLPLVATMDLQQFTGVLAHELGHFSQGVFLRLMFIIQRINGWFGRMAFGRSGIDDVLDGMMGGEEVHGSILIIAALSKLVLLVARMLTTVMALISGALSMHLSRQAEFDADRQAARIVGSEPLAAGLELLPAMSVANTVAIERARARWDRRELPDDLVLLTGHFHQQMPATLKDKVEAKILSSENSWFDSHPPLFKRIAELKKARYTGVMKINAPATELFKDFDELCKIATIDFYSDAVGKALQPEHIVSTKLPSFKSEARLRGIEV